MSFLASPGDLVEERRIAKEVVEEINRSIRLLNWNIELLGWEDTLPGYMRPQEIINREVDVCELFIGLLWRRWGQPTGTHESGFQEEFERARERRLQTASPEIWLFFKAVESEQLEDPGEQLKRVIAFRKSLEVSKELFFKEFKDSSDWRAKLRESLLSYVLSLVPSTIEAPAIAGPAESSIARSPEASPSHAAVEEKVDKKPATTQLLDVVNATTKGITEGEFASLQNIQEGTTANDQFSAARLHLFGLSWISELNTGELLETHSINILFVQRKRHKLLGPERSLLFRTVVGQFYETSPGWFWVRHFDAETTEALLFHLARRDTNPTVRKGALEILRSAGIRLKDTKYISKEDYIKSILADNSESVLGTATRFLASSADLEDLPIIRSAGSENTSIRPDELLETEQLITISKGNPIDLAKLLPTLKSTATKAINEIEKRLEELDDNALLGALNHESSSIRAMLIKILARRQKLSTAKLRAFLSDPSPAIKEACLEQLIRQGVQVSTDEIRKSVSPSLLTGSDPDPLILMLFQPFDYETLISNVDWFSLDGEIAYKALALNHFSRVSGRIRSDLQDRFETLRSNSIKNLYASCGELANDLVKNFAEKGGDDYVRDRFVAAALAGLAESGEPGDVVIARQYLERGDAVRVEAVRILSRFGEASDADTLFSIARTSYGQLKEHAAKAAIKLLPGSDGALRLLLEGEDRILMKLAVNALLDEDPEKVGLLLEPLLDRKDDNIRLVALTYFLRRYSDEQLEQLLHQYLDKPSYYYNIVCWLDRILFAPPPLKDHFRRELANRYG